MLGFVDESGDTGFKLDRGSSATFVVAMVVFTDRDEAQRCDDRIASLREELSLRVSHEFHFSHNAPRLRAAFLEAVQPFAFRVHVLVADKVRLLKQGLGEPITGLYETATDLLFTDAKPYLSDAIVTLDTRGGRHPETLGSIPQKALERGLVSFGPPGEVREVFGQQPIAAGRLRRGPRLPTKHRGARRRRPLWAIPWVERSYVALVAIT